MRVAERIMSRYRLHQTGRNQYPGGPLQSPINSHQTHHKKGGGQGCGGVGGVGQGGSIEYQVMGEARILGAHGVGAGGVGGGQMARGGFRAVAGLKYKGDKKA